MSELIKKLIKEGWLKTPEIIEAFQKIKRADFMPEEIKGFAELNEPLSIGYEQTISQPLTVAFMLELLEPKAGDKILDIGSGSGWTTALLSYVVSRKKGKVIAIEIIPELKEFGKKNLSKYPLKDSAQFICADGSKGYEKEAPYDKILASAAARELPQAWKDQLKVGGRIVVPIESSIWLFIKKSNDEFVEHEHPGFTFVPLIIDRAS